MNNSASRRDAMKDALRLVRGGHLRAATQLIQDSLRRAPAARTPASPASPQVPVLTHEAEEAVFTDEAPAAPATRAVPPAVEDPLPPQPGAEHPSPPLARRLPRRFAPSTTPSRLDYRLALPDADASPCPVLLHGCQQDAADFARGTGMERMAVARGYIVVHPEQAAGANPSRCWNWFRPQDQRRGDGEPAAILRILDEVAANHPVDAARIYVAGLSAGAAMAVILAANYPDRLAAVGAHSGLAYAAAGNVPSAFSAMRGGGVAPALPAPDGVNARYVPLLVLHGEGDTTVAPRNADRLLAQWLASAPDAPGWRRSEAAAVGAGRAARRTTWRSEDGRSMLEHWHIEGAGHAWSGGDRGGSFTDPEGPDASAILLDFFAQHALPR
jgi:poly(hydroxyalkanoate) depolymerase family esterase